MRHWLTAWLDQVHGYTSLKATSVRAGAGCSPNCAYRDDEHDSPAPALARHYRVDQDELPAVYHAVVRPLRLLDAETEAFIASCRPSWWADAAARLLRLFLSLTDTNGVLQRGQMFVLSTEACQSLLGPGLAEARGKGKHNLALLDVGAGDGEVTSRVARAGGFTEVACTEVSRPMARRLTARGWACTVTPHIGESVLPRNGHFDVVSLMNLLDRCDHPAEILRDAARLAVPGTGRILVALVLPFADFVEEGTGRRAPLGRLPMTSAKCQDGVTFEASLAAFLQRVVQPAGLMVERIARAPYLCRGDSNKRYYVLSDAILVLKHATPEAGA